MRDIKEILNGIRDNAPHLTEMRDELGQLISELALIGERGIPVDRRLMSVDLDSLFDLTAELAAFRRSGISNDEVELAIKHLSSLVKEMRVKSCLALKERSRDILAHASISSQTGDQPEDYDVTKSFRMMVATQDNSPIYDDELIVESFGFPEMGGPAGSVEGEVYYVHALDIKTHDKKVAPQDTVLIPKGSFVRLEEDECIIIHQAGMIEGMKIGLEKYDEEQKSILITAGEGGALLRGPMTFSPCPESSPYNPRVMFGMAQEMRREIDNTPWYKKLNSFMFGLVGMGALVSTFYFLYFQNITSILFFIFALITYFAIGAIAGAIVSFIPAIIMNALHVGVPRRNDISYHKEISEQAFGPNTKKTTNTSIDDYYLAMSFFERNVHQTKKLRIYPKRRAVIDKNKGAMIMKPLLSLPKPEPVFADNIIPLKERAT